MCVCVRERERDGNNCWVGFCRVLRDAAVLTTTATSRRSRSRSKHTPPLPYRYVTLLTNIEIEGGGVDRAIDQSIFTLQTQAVCVVVVG